jgi:UDP-glucose 4-epimerase
MVMHKYSDAVKPARVVLLGAGGFLAPKLRRRLEDGDVSVLAIGSKELDLAGAGAAEKLAELVRPDDSVVMAAALTPEKGRDIGTMMKNLRMAESVCGSIKKSRVAHFVYISSDGVYDGRTTSLLNESSTCEPSDLYSLMHIARERMLALTCRECGIPLSVLRPCAIYGPEDTHNSYGPNRFIRTASSSGKITLFGEGEETRHHVYVDDVVQIIYLSLMHQSAGVLNAITGQGISFRALSDLIREAVGLDIVVECLPRTGPITHRQFDLTALARSFPGLQTTPISVGIAKTAKAMVSQC